MRALKYIRYFLYLAYNWNFRIAKHMIKQEIRGEKKYGLDTTGADELASVKKRGIDISHATIYMPASYDLMEELFNKLKGKRLQHFTDIGCGKGRAMGVAAHYNFTSVTGIDFSDELYNNAKQNMESIQARFPLLTCELVKGDALYYTIPADTDCIFLFNPFDETIMRGVIKNIELQRLKTAREVFIIYINPMHKNVFFENGYKEVFYTKKLNYLEGCILLKK